MRTVLLEGPYRFYLHSHEPNGPPHVHVDRDVLSAKSWLGPAALARNLGFDAVERRRVERLVTEHEAELREAWDGFFAV